MRPTTTKQVFAELRRALRSEIRRHDLTGRAIHVRCSALTASQVIGNPEHRDYPVLRGKESMIEAVLESARGQAYSDELEEADYRVEDLLTLKLDSNARRAHFVAGLNAVLRHVGRIKRTIHCRDAEPVQCAAALGAIYPGRERVLLVGLQPRLLESLVATSQVRVLDLDPDNVDEAKYGVTVEPPDHFAEAVRWCDRILATGSTLVNGTIGPLLRAEKPIVFYGVTISAAAYILDLNAFCAYGR